MHMENSGDEAGAGKQVKLRTAWIAVPYSGGLA